MIYQSREGRLFINGVSMSYVVFGYGSTPLILLPGLSDGIKSVSGQAVPIAIAYRKFAKNYRIYMFSRKDEIPNDYSIRDMAIDQKNAMDQLGIEKCFLIGVSQGGMIAQQFAIQFPNKVEKLVIAVSASRIDELCREVLSSWINFAERGDYASLMIDTMKRSYTPKKLMKMRIVSPVLSKIGRPNCLKRFIIQAQACIAHDVYDRLTEINCSTLLIGGKLDKVVGFEATLDMAKKIRNSHLIVYPESGHAAYEEKHFVDDVIKFLDENKNDYRVGYS
ncbi:alpha/beta fold hydrolase [Enterococcus sp. DIV0756]|uniref:alpha/beta fold hydrolase n=1 Tax=Enterococcus sp. DIV0756 TaxID=2774636 RepID=UPI003F208F71